MGSVPEGSRSKAVKAQGNSVGPVGLRTGKRNLQLAVGTQVRSSNKIISKTRQMGKGSMWKRERQ